MRIINVIESLGGILLSIESFVCPNDDKNPISKIVVENAEKLFAEEAKAKGCTDTEAAIDDGYWSDTAGYHIIIAWSSNVHP